jgi:hypothetical protein
MKRLILFVLIVAVVFSPFGKSVQSKSAFIWRSLISSFDTGTQNARVKPIEGSSIVYSKNSNQTNSYTQTPRRRLRDELTQLKRELSSAVKQNSAGYALSQQRATNARDFNYQTTTSIKQQRYEINQAFKQSNVNNISQSLVQSRTSMARELSSY